MNQIQEKDWADTSWHGHTGMDSTCDYCVIDETSGGKPSATPEAAAAATGIDTKTEQIGPDQG